jgi:hypothetical protein
VPALRRKSSSVGTIVVILVGFGRIGKAVPRVPLFIESNVLKARDLDLGIWWDGGQVVSAHLGHGSAWSGAIEVSPTTRGILKDRR